MRRVKQKNVCAWEAKSGSQSQPYLTRDSELSIKWLLLLPAKTRPSWRKLNEVKKKMREKRKTENRKIKK